MEQLSILKDLVVIVAAAVLVVLVLRRVGIPSIVGFIIAGVVVGPHSVGLISDAHEVETLAEIGVVLLLFGVGLAVAGLLELTLAVNLLTALLGAVALAGYIFVYTPMKRVSSLATVVGAIPGALPPLMGWTAVSDRLELGGIVLFAILFLWQLPHFLAIAWMCREDYARAGIPVLPVVEPDGRSTARQMMLYGAALLPVSLLPTVLGLTGGTYFIGTLALGCFFLAVCVSFALSFSTGAARRVLLVSVLYLPAVLVVMVLDRVA